MRFGSGSRWSWLRKLMSRRAGLMSLFFGVLVRGFLGGGWRNEGVWFGLVWGVIYRGWVFPDPST